MLLRTELAPQESEDRHSSTSVNKRGCCAAFYVKFSNSLIIHVLMTESACINWVRCMYFDTQWTYRSRHIPLVQKLIKTLVVIEATLVGNQSERSKFRLDQSESRISPMWLIDVTTHCFCPRDPIGIKNTRTQGLDLHSWHSFNDRVKPWVQAGRMWPPNDVTPIFFALIHKIKIRCLLLGGKHKFTYFYSEFS